MAPRRRANSNSLTPSRPANAEEFAVLLRQSNARIIRTELPTTATLANMTPNQRNATNTAKLAVQFLISSTQEITDFTLAERQSEDNNRLTQAISRAANQTVFR